MEELSRSCSYASIDLPLLRRWASGWNRARKGWTVSAPHRARRWVRNLEVAASSLVTMLRLRGLMARLALGPWRGHSIVGVADRAPLPGCSLMDCAHVLWGGLPTRTRLPLMKSPCLAREQPRCRLGLFSFGDASPPREGRLGRGGPCGPGQPGPAPVDRTPSWPAIPTPRPPSPVRRRSPWRGRVRACTLAAAVAWAWMPKRVRVAATVECVSVGRSAPSHAGGQDGTT